MPAIAKHRSVDPLARFLPDELRDLPDPQRDLPRIAKDARLMGIIESTIGEVPTRHDLHCADCRSMDSTKRLDVLADFCIQELSARGMKGARANQDIPGGGRTKNWDVTWEYDGKFRLAISLKSLLKNIAGTVPNRIDDLMGEVANAQLYSPEFVTGYIMVFDISQDGHSPKHGSTWLELLRSRLQTLSGRCPPAWTTGTVEAFVLAEVDFSQSATLISDSRDFKTFFDQLAVQVARRNPNALDTSE